MTLLAAAVMVHPDEPCYLLSELVEKSADESGWRRVQRVYVNRDGHMAVHVRDLGAAANFTAPQTRILSLWEDSVAYCMDQAEHQRLGEDYWVKFLAEKTAESTLIPDTIRFVEEGARIVRSRSVFGSHVRKQRNFSPRRVKHGNGTH